MDALEMLGNKPGFGEATDTEVRELVFAYLRDAAKAPAQNVEVGDNSPKRVSVRRFNEKSADDPALHISAFHQSNSSVMSIRTAGKVTYAGGGSVNLQTRYMLTFKNEDAVAKAFKKAAKYNTANEKLAVLIRASVSMTMNHEVY